jgi:aminoglycoside phosphotransferase (APT) family kinase protein
MAFEGIERTGGAIRRPAYRWSPSIAAVLQHLERREFPGVPRVLQAASEGLQELSFVEGECHTGKWPAEIRSDAALGRIARLLRQMHDHTATFPEGLVLPWIAGDAARESGQVVLHGDLSMSNLVWRGAQPIAFIDWEFAEPGPAYFDVLHALLSLVPLYEDSVCLQFGFVEPPDRDARIELFLAEYGRPDAFFFPDPRGPEDVARDLVALMARDADRIAHLGHRRLEPWAAMLDRGHIAANERCRAWISAWADRLS